ncbi:MAG: proton-conducting transporter membrane subunit [Propionivibrio sp.]
MLYAVMSGFVAAALLPLLHRFLGARSSLVAAVVPLALTVWFATSLPRVASGEVLVSQSSWLPEIHLELGFRLDGLSLLFALLISAIGALVILYTSAYLHGNPRQHQFVSATLMFMASMLGVVLADNLVLLFIFWELTSFTSYLLIGFDHEKEESRKAALQALLVTGLGGLFLLAGVLLLGTAAGSFSLTEILRADRALAGHADYPVILGLILVGAFSKSAQTPFHFWLPNAMQAPTPASAYLHSSTMVKAGVYLLARLNPVLGGTEAWIGWLTAVGVLTLLTGALMASAQVYLKRLLAYTTVAALGFMVMLLGIGSERAVQAAVVFLMAHACYKASLFLVAGIITHETGEADVRRLGGLLRFMPVAGACSVVAAVSMAGLPLSFGFVAKELVYASVLDRFLVFIPAVAASLLFVVVAFQVGIKPFLPGSSDSSGTPHEAPPAMLAGPVILGLACLAGGFFPQAFAGALAASAAAAIQGGPVSELDLQAWHGITPESVASALTLMLGIAAVFATGHWVRIGSAMKPLANFGPDRVYVAKLKGLNLLAVWQTRVLQSGSLRRYVAIIVLAMVGLFGLSVLRSGELPILNRNTPLTLPSLILGLLIMLGAIGSMIATSRISAVAALGVVGFCVSLIYVLHGAPDLAMTQLVVEALGAVLLVSAFLNLPSFHDRKRWVGRFRDAVVAILGGLAMTLMTLMANDVQLAPSIAHYFAETSVLLGHGRNIVNVILVDFRALDTLGEITVLAIAGASAVALLKLRMAAKRRS